MLRLKILNFKANNQQIIIQFYNHLEILSPSSSLLTSYTYLDLIKSDKFRQIINNGWKLWYHKSCCHIKSKLPNLKQNINDKKLHQSVKDDNKLHKTSKQSVIWCNSISIVFLINNLRFLKSLQLDLSRSDKITQIPQFIKQNRL